MEISPEISILSILALFSLHISLQRCLIISQVLSRIGRSILVEYTKPDFLGQPELNSTEDEEDKKKYSKAMLPSI